MVSHTLYSSVVMSACVCRCVCWCVGQMVGMDKRELLCDPQVAVHRIQPAKRHYNTWRRLRVEREGNNEWRRHSRTQTNTASKRQRAQRLKRMPVLSVYFSLTAVISLTYNGGLYDQNLNACHLFHNNEIDHNTIIFPGNKVMAPAFQMT